MDNKEKVYLPMEVEKVIEINKDPNKVYLFEIEVGEMSNLKTNDYILRVKELVNAQGITNCIFYQTREGRGSIKVSAIDKPENIELNTIVTGEQI